MTWTDISNIFSIVLIINTLSAVFTVFKEKRPVAATWGWLLVLIFLPIIGFILYLFIGRKMSQQKIFDLQAQKALDMRRIIETFEIENESLEDGTSCYLNPEKKAISHMLYVSGNETIVTARNKVDLFFDAETKFKRLIEDIDQATDHVHLVYYIVNDDTIGCQLIAALERACERGVEVSFLYDPIGGRLLSKNAFKRLKELGGRINVFFGREHFMINFKLNYRNHRKIAIIDGEIAYLGGINIGDEYLGKGPLGAWRDTHSRIEGQAVSALQIRFMQDWNAVNIDKDDRYFTPERRYFPQSQVKEQLEIQISSSGPDEEVDQIKMGFVKMIHSAKESIDIQTPYFVPDDSVYEAISMAAKAGVKVRIMIPSGPDHPFVYRATEYFAREILQKNIEIYKYDAGFLHAKTLVVDNTVASLGTSNFDVRSFSLNFEVNGFFYNTVIANELTRQFDKDIENCTLLDHDYFKNQNLWLKVRQDFSRLLSPIL